MTILEEGEQDTRDWQTWDEAHKVMGGSVSAKGHDWGEAGAAAEHAKGHHTPWSHQDKEVVQHAHEEAEHVPEGKAHEGHETMSDPEYREHRNHVEHETIAHGAHDLMRSPFSTHNSQDRVAGVEGAYTPERQKLHAQILAEYDERARTVPTAQRAVIMGGLGGAGKSTVLRTEAQSPRSVAGKLGIKYDTYDKKGNGVGEPTNFITVNPDDIKERMAELGALPTVDHLSPMESSTFAHEEASMLAARVADRMQAQGKNVIHDITLNSVGSGEKRIDALRQAGVASPTGLKGYHVSGVMVDVSTEQSKMSAEKRHRGGQDRFAKGIGQGGRYVPSDLILGAKDPQGIYRSKNRAAFETLKAQGRFDHTITIDNEGYANKLLSETGHRDAFGMLTGLELRATSDITDKILAYRRGTMAFQNLVTDLANRSYSRPSAMDIPGQTMADTESRDWSEPGTWGEVQHANDTGLLTDDEFGAIHSATMAAHGERAIDPGEMHTRDWTKWNEEHRPFGKQHYIKAGDHEAAEAWARGHHEVTQDHHFASATHAPISHDQHAKEARKAVAASYAKPLTKLNKRDRVLTQAYHEGRAHAHHDLARSGRVQHEGVLALTGAIRVEPGEVDTRDWKHWNEEHPYQHHGHHKPLTSYAQAFFGKGKHAYKPPPPKTPEQLAAEKAAREAAAALAAAEHARRAVLAGHEGTVDPHNDGPDSWDKRDWSSRYGGVMFDHDGRILLREPTNHFDGYHWTFSKGHPDAKDEHPTQVAIRETEEETGLSPRIIGRVPGGFGGSGTSSRNHFYLQEDSGAPFDASKMNGETQSLAWATPAQADVMIQRGTNAQGVYRDRQVLRAAVAAHSKLTGTPNIQLAPLGPPPEKPKPIFLKPIKPSSAKPVSAAANSPAAKAGQKKTSLWYPGMKLDERADPEHDPRSTMISLDIPPGTIEPVPGGLPDTQHHITIVYAGKIDQDAFAKVMAAAQDVAAKTAPLHGVIGGLGSFEPSEGSDGLRPYFAVPNIPGIEKVHDPVAHLSKSEHTEYHPHMTLTYAEEGDTPPEPIPPTPVSFTHLSVHRGGQCVAKFPFTGIRVEQSEADPLVRNWAKWHMEHPYIHHPRTKHFHETEHHAHKPTVEPPKVMPDAKSLPIPAPKVAPSTALTNLKAEWTDEARKAHNFKAGSTRAQRFEAGYIAARLHAQQEGMSKEQAHELSDAHDTIAAGLQANQAQAKREGVAAGYHAHSIGYSLHGPAPVAQGTTAAQLRPGDVIMHQGKPMKVTKAPKDWHAAGIKSANPDEVEVVLKDASMSGGGGEAFDLHKDYEPEMVSLSSKPVLESSQISADAAKPNVAPVGHLGVPETEDQLNSLKKVMPGSKFSNGETVPQTGSNGGAWYDDGAGNAYFLKGSQSDEHAMNEVAGSLAYKQAGLEAQDVTLVHMNDGSVRALSHYMTGLSPILGPQDTSNATRASARAGYGMDALMSHYDLTGMVTSSGAVDGPNLFKDKNGVVTRLDLGGTGRFRAQGGKKLSWKVGGWDPEAMADNDYESIRSGKQGQLAYGVTSPGLDSLPGDMQASLADAVDFDTTKYHQAMLSAGLPESFADAQVKVMADRQEHLKQVWLKEGAQHPDDAYQEGHKAGTTTAENMESQSGMNAAAIQHEAQKVHAGMVKTNPYMVGMVDGMHAHAAKMELAAATADESGYAPGTIEHTNWHDGYQQGIESSAGPETAKASAEMYAKSALQPQSSESKASYEGLAAGYAAKAIPSTIEPGSASMPKAKTADNLLPGDTFEFNGAQYTVDSTTHNGPNAAVLVYANGDSTPFTFEASDIFDVTEPDEPKSDNGPSAFHAGEKAGKAAAEHLLANGQSPSQVHDAANAMSFGGSGSSKQKGWAKAAHAAADAAALDAGPASVSLTNPYPSITQQHGDWQAAFDYAHIYAEDNKLIAASAQKFADDQVGKKPDPNSEGHNKTKASIEGLQAGYTDVARKLKTPMSVQDAVSKAKAAGYDWDKAFASQKALADSYDDMDAVHDIIKGHQADLDNALLLHDHMEAAKQAALVAAWRKAKGEKEAGQVDVGNLQTGDVINHPGAGIMNAPVEVVGHTKSPSGAHFVTTKDIGGPNPGHLQDHIVADGTMLKKVAPPQESHEDGSKLLADVVAGDEYAGGYKVSAISHSDDPLEPTGILHTSITGPHGSTSIDMQGDASINQAIAAHEQKIQEDAVPKTPIAEWTASNAHDSMKYVENSDGSVDTVHGGEVGTHFDPGEEANSVKANLQAGGLWQKKDLTEQAPVAGSEKPAGTAWVNTGNLGQESNPIQKFVKNEDGSFTGYDEDGDVFSKISADEAASDDDHLETLLSDPHNWTEHGAVAKWTNPVDSTGAMGYWIEHPDGSFDGYDDEGKVVYQAKPSENEKQQLLNGNPPWTSEPVVGGAKPVVPEFEEQEPNIPAPLDVEGKGENYGPNYMKNYQLVKEHLSSDPEKDSKHKTPDEMQKIIDNSIESHSGKSEEELPVMSQKGGFAGMVEGGQKALADFQHGRFSVPSMGKMKKHNEDVSGKHLVEYTSNKTQGLTVVSAGSLKKGNKVLAVPTKKAMQQWYVTVPASDVLGVVTNKKDASKVDITTQDASGVVHQYTLPKTTNVKAKPGIHETVTGAPHPVQTSSASLGGSSQVATKDLKLGDKVLHNGVTYTVTKTFPGDTPFVTGGDISDLNQLGLTGLSAVEVVGGTPRPQAGMVKMSSLLVGDKVKADGTIWEITKTYGSYAPDGVDANGNTKDFGSDQDALVEKVSSATPLSSASTIQPGSATVEAVPTTAPPADFVQAFTEAEKLTNLGKKEALPQRANLTEDELKQRTAYAVARERAEVDGADLTAGQLRDRIEAAKLRQAVEISASGQAAALGAAHGFQVAMQSAAPDPEAKTVTELHDDPIYHEAREAAQAKAADGATSRELYQIAGNYSVNPEDEARHLAYHEVAEQVDQAENEKPMVDVEHGHAPMTEEQLAYMNEMASSGNKTGMSEGGDLEKWAYDQGRALGINAGNSALDNGLTPADVEAKAVVEDALTKSTSGLLARKHAGIAKGLHRVAKAAHDGSYKKDEGYTITTSANESNAKPDVKYHGPMSSGTGSSGYPVVHLQPTSAEKAAISTWTTDYRFGTQTAFIAAVNKIMQGKSPGTGSAAEKAKTFMKMAAEKSTPSTVTIYRGTDGDEFSSGQMTKWKDALAKGETVDFSMPVASSTYSSGIWSGHSYRYVIDPGAMTVDIGQFGEHTNEIETVTGGLMEVYKIEKSGDTTFVHMRQKVHYVN